MPRSVIFLLRSDDDQFSKFRFVGFQAIFNFRPKELLVQRKPSNGMRAALRKSPVSFSFFRFYDAIEPVSKPSSNRHYIGNDS